MNTETRAGRLEKLRQILLLVVPLVYVAVLSFSFSDEWFPADDRQELFFVRNAGSVYSLLGSDVFGLFRPIKNLLFFLFARLEPAGVKWCRLVGVGIGVLSFFPVLALCRRILGSEWKALIAAAVWLLSPTLVSSAAWLSCVNIQIMVSFAALAIACHNDAWNANGLRQSRILLAGVFFFLSLVSYECAISLLPILFFFDLFLRPERIRNRRVWSVYAFYVFIAVSYLIFRHCFNSSTKVNGSFTDIERWQLVVSSPFFTAQHFYSWFWPFGRFTVFGSYQWGQVSGTVLVLCALFFISLLVLALVGRKRNPVISFCIVFALFAFAPVSNCLGLKSGPYGDYYLTLVSLGLAIGCVEAGACLLGYSGKLRPLLVLIVVCFGLTRLFAIPESVRWARLWSQGQAAFFESIRNYPEFFSNKQMAATILFDSGYHLEALEYGRQVENAVGSDSFQMSGVYLIRALYALEDEKNADKALAAIADSLRVGVEISGRTRLNAHYYRGCVFEDLKNDAEAAESEYMLALSEQWSIDSVPCVDRLARLKVLRGELEEAIMLWERAAKLDPDNAAVGWNLAVAKRQAQVE
ncbi:MAG: hypothetical protein ILO34_03780 [Kiritimatiellae bacterium]|nr:hypothetical protein [Kiritimatiellia bacterium]